MGGIVTRLWWGGEPDEKDSVSGMTRRDVYYIQKSWKVIFANAPVNGFLIFSRLFHASPESKTLFNNISHMSDEELSRSIVFKAHVVLFMSSLNSAVAHLPQPDLLAIMMQKLGETHYKRHVRRKDFLIVRDELKLILQNELQLDADTVASWGLFINFIYQHIFSKLPE